MEAIFAVINTTEAMVIRPEKNPGFYRILTRYLRDTNTVLHQVAFAVTMIVLYSQVIVAWHAWL